MKKIVHHVFTLWALLFTPVIAFFWRLPLWQVIADWNKHRISKEHWGRFDLNWQGSHREEKR
jgi:hypothetical protein